MEKIRAGIVGCGGIAQSKVAAIFETQEIDIIAFCDCRIEAARKLAELYGSSDAKTFEDYRDLIKQDLDVVYVYTPNRTHCEITVAALHSGKHVMCEKPMAINYKEASEMLATSKETGKLLNIGYQNRFRPDSIYLKKECEKGTLGEIYYAKAKALRRRAVPTWGVFLNKEEQGGGPLLDIGTHALDLTLWMMDNYKPKSVTGTVFHKLNKDLEPGNAFGDWDINEFDVEDSAFGFITMENGATIVLESSWALNILDNNEAKTVLCGTKAGADMLDGLRINGVKNNCQYIEKPFLGEGGVDFFFTEEPSPQFLEQKAFIRAIRGEAPLVVLPEQAVVVTQILEAIYESARIGKQIIL